MKKNICVLIRGQLREWDKAKFSIFLTFRHLEQAHNVHYIFAVWDESYTRTDSSSLPVITKISDEQLVSLRNDFANKNFELAIANTQQFKNKNSRLKLQEEYESISYIRFFANSIKRKYERTNGITFDAVFETRPDIFILPQTNPTLLSDGVACEIADMIVYSTVGYDPRVHSYLDVRRKLDIPFSTFFVDDNFYLTSNLTNNILNKEYLYYYHLFTKKDPVLRSHLLFSAFQRSVGIVNVGFVNKYISKYSIVRDSWFFDFDVDFTKVNEQTYFAVEQANIKFVTHKIGRS